MVPDFLGPIARVRRGALNRSAAAPGGPYMTPIQDRSTQVGHLRAIDGEPRSHGGFPRFPLVEWKFMRNIKYC